MENYRKDDIRYKANYNVYISKITAPKYLKDTIALDEKIDSIAVIINKYLPRKECHDSICINYHLYKPINNTYFHEKEKKYKINLGAYNRINLLK